MNRPLMIRGHKGVIRLIETIICIASLLSLTVSISGCIKGSVKRTVIGQISGVVVLGLCLLYIWGF